MRILDKVLFVSAVVGRVASFKLTWFSSKNGQEPIYGGPPGAPPHRPVHWPGVGDETIYTVVSQHKDYTKLTKAINFVEEIATILNDTSTEVTFFAVPDSALQRRPRREMGDDIMKAYDLSDAVQLVDDFKLKDKKHKKFVKKLVRAILSYHILPSRYNSARLSDNNTYPTNLILPDAIGARPLRIKVSSPLFPPTPTVNFYSRIIHPDGAASNGVIHSINHPLLPPPPVFQELFMLPRAFATLTSSIQRTGLTNALDLKYIRGKKGKKGHLEGATALTIFAPSNIAFDALPPRLRFYLFSPFGAPALKKLLQYHIVPAFVFHTDYQFNKSESSVLVNQMAFDFSKLGPLGTDHYPLQYPESSPTSGMWDPNGLLDTDFTTLLHPQSWKSTSSSRIRPIPAESYPSCGERQHGEPIDSFTATLPTLLPNHTLHVHVERFNLTIPLPGPHKPHRISTRFVVNGRPVAVPDGVGLNGAVHAIHHLIDPRHTHDDSVGDPYEDWESWLPQWAAEN